MTTRTRSKAGTGSNTPTSPAQFQTKLSYSKLKENAKLKEKQPEVCTNSESTNRSNSDGEKTAVKIKRENIETSLNNWINKNGTKETNDTKLKESTNKDDKGSVSKNNTVPKILITQSPSAKRRPVQSANSNKKKRYYKPINELLEQTTTEAIPTLNNIVQKELANELQTEIKENSPTEIEDYSEIAQDMELDEEIPRENGKNKRTHRNKQAESTMKKNK